MNPDQHTFTLNDITIPHQHLDTQALLANWRWLVPEDWAIVFITIFGDAFLIDPATQQVYFLDTAEGDLELISEDIASFERLLAEDNEFVVDYFSLSQWLGAKEALVGDNPPPKDMVFNYITPFVLGGEAEPDNIELFPVDEHFAMSGDFWEKMQALEEELAAEIEEESKQ